MTRIGLIQMQCEKGAIAQNLASIDTYLKEAARRGVDIIGFPEMSLTGYADPRKYPQAVIRLDGPEIQQVLRLTRPYSLTVLIGLIEQNPQGKPFITHIVARQGTLAGYYRKVTIKDEETEWFSPGEDIPTFESNRLTFGLAICADIHNERVFAESSLKGAKLVFELAAPGLYGEQATRDWPAGYAWWESECQQYLSRYTQEYGIWVGVATQAGRTVDEDFPGGGYVFAPSGERVYATTDWFPGAVYIDLDWESGQAVSVER